VSIGELARDCHVSSQTMNRVVRAMCGRELLTLIVEDRRGKPIRVELAPLGSQILRSCRPVMESVEDRLVADIPRPALEELHETLSAIIRNLRFELRRRRLEEALRPPEDRRRAPG
jgi:DNA-binding MarR family transcriptional regulator